MENEANVFLAIIIIGLGAALVGSGLTGTSLTDYLAGNFGKLNPKGGRGGSSPANAGVAPGTGATVAQGTDPKGKFKGPNAATLRFLADNATQNFNLTITQICRPASASYGSPTSFHHDCRAFDAVGKVDDKIAYARWAKPIIDKIPGGEIFIDQLGWSAPGYEHTSHVHTGA